LSYRFIIGHGETQMLRTTSTSFDLSREVEVT